MSSASYANRDHLERNLEELLMRGTPAPVMPDSARARIRQRLLAAGAGQPVHRATPRLFPLGFLRPWPRAALAVAAVMVLVFVLWPGVSSDGVSWADVQSRLAAARSFTAEMRTVELTADGPREAYRARVFFQDPGRSRTELFPVGEGEGRGPLRPGEQVASVDVLVREPGQARQLFLEPRRRFARQVSHRFEGSLSASRPLVDLAATAWQRLARLASSSPRELGEKVFGGLRLVGFEAPAEELFEIYQDGITAGVVRLWVSPETADPVRVELEFRSPGGKHFQTVASNVAWDVPLAEDLFHPSVPPDWTLQRVRRVIRGFDRRGLAGGVTLTVGPHDGEPLTAAADVVGAIEGESIEELASAMPSQVVITFELTSAATRRLAAFTAEHPGALLVADFNGETLAVPEWGSPGSGTLRLDLTRLGKTLAEIEQQYLKEIQP